VRISSTLIAIYVPTALLAFSQGLLIATVPLYGAELGVSYQLISLAVGAAAIGTLATDLPAGAFLRQIGLRPALISGSALVAVSTLAIGVSNGFAALVIFRFLAGIGTALWALSRHAYIAEAIPAHQRGKALSLFGGINRAGIFAGPAAGGIVATTFGLSASFVLAALLAFAALAVALVLLKPTPRAPARLARGVRWALVARLVQSNWQDLLSASVAMTLGQMIRAGRHLIIPLYGAERLGLDAAQIGLVISLGAVIDISMFLPAGVLMDRFGRKVAAVPSFAIMALGVALIPLAADFTGLLLAAMVIGLGNGLGSGVMMTLGADLAPPEATGEFLGVWRLLGDTGSAVGPIAIGFVAGWFGLAGGALVLAGLGLLASLTLALLVQETRVSPLPEAG
jgi:MFS family permease